jgi:2,5-furandicarboxylate decarboxylase 1
MSGPTPSETQDLRAFLVRYRADHPDDVLVIDDDISSDQDVTALVWELAARGREELIVCTRVNGLGAELITNVFASRRRIARLLGSDPTHLHEAYQSKARTLIPPRILDTGPVLDRLDTDDALDLSTLPMITHFETDAAPYITSGVIFAQHPDTGSGNLSYHRAMIHSRNELATSLHSRGHLWRMVQRALERNELLPAAMIIGGHPLFLLAASARVGEGVDERYIAGGLFGEPLDIVLTPRYHLGVPASAEIVLEGVIDPVMSVPEGPFGEFTGYSSNRSTNTVFRVETILQRNNAVLLDVVGGNSAEHLNLARVPRESEMAEKLKERFPSVTGIHYPNSGTHFHCYVALRQRRPGEARQVMLGLLGWDPYLKTVIAVDDDIDITDDGHVLWAMATHVQPHQDLFTIDGLPGSPLDPSSTSTGTTSRLAIDATRGPEFDGRPAEISERAFHRARELLNRRAEGQPK